MPEFDPMDVLGDAQPAPSFQLSPQELRAEEAVRVAPRATPRGALVCTSCGSLVQGKTLTPGSFLIEVCLWLFMLLPGALYSVWRLAGRRRACEVCGGGELIPAASPRGRQLLERARD